MIRKTQAQIQRQSKEFQHSYQTVGSRHRVTHLAVFAEVCPHAGPIPSPHQHVVYEEVSAGNAADELAREAVVVVAQVGDYVVKLEDLVAFVGVL